jgi:hypothetical protein
MKQNIEFEKNIEENKLIIRESGEVDPGVNMALIEEEYILDLMTKASAEGLKAFRQHLRTKSFFPNTPASLKLFEETVEFFKSDDISLSVSYDDNEGLPQEEAFFPDEIIELDHLLAEDGEASEDELKEIDDTTDSPLKYSPEDISEDEN